MEPSESGQPARPTAYSEEEQSDIDFLKNVVTVISYSTQEQQVASLIVDEMVRRGFSARVDEAGNAIGELGGPGSSMTLLFAGHMDTVKGEIPVRIEDGFLYGRGSVDAKGPLCAFICAAAKAGPEKLRIIVAGCVEEESASSKGARFLLDRYKPDMIVIGEPSGADCVTLGYKGRLLIDYSLKIEESHGASDAKRAGEQAVDFYLTLSEYASLFNAGKKTGFERVQLSLKSINTSSDGLAETADMVLSLRIPLGFDVSQFKDIAQRSQGTAQLTFRAEEVPIKSDKNNPLVRAFVKAIRDAGTEPCFKLKSGTADMNVLGQRFHVPILAYGPGDSSLDHTPNERISIAEYLKSVEIIASALKTIILTD